MGRPRRLLLREDRPGTYFVRGFSIREFARREAFRLGRVVLRRPAAPPVFLGRRAREDDGLTLFVFRRAVRASPVACEVIDYAPDFLLVPAAGGSRAAAQEALWRSIEDYAEHRPAAAQDPAAQRLTRWLTADVLRPLGTSFLEVGCGAGRNLVGLKQAMPEARVEGLEIHAGAVAAARAALGEPAAVHEGSLFDLRRFRDRSFDVVFTSAVLSHVPHDRVPSVMREFHRIARRAVVLFELHGRPHGFDFHRYARDYAALYASLGLPVDVEVTVYGRRDWRNRRAKASHYCLVVARPRTG